jgi:hypothetical protein
MILKTWDKEIIDLRNSKEIAQKPDHLPMGSFIRNIQLLKMKEISCSGKKTGSERKSKCFRCR